MTKRALSIVVLLILSSLSPPAWGQECNVDPPLLLSPLDGRSDVQSIVQFSWTAVQGAVEYRLVMKRQTDENFSVIETTRRLSTIQVLPPGSYSWGILAVVPDCGAIESDPSSFIIQQASDCTVKPAPVAISPSDVSIQSNDVTFSWERAMGAVAHAIWIVPETGFPTRLETTTAGSQITVRIPFGRYRWFVEATFPGCDPVRSEPARFEVVVPEGCREHRPPIILAPDRGASVTSPVRVAWSSVPDAVEYRVYTLDAGEEVQLRATVQGNRFAVDLEPGIVAWLVEAVFPSCPSVRSTPSLLRVVDQIPCRVPARPLIRGVRKTISGQPYVLRWSASAQPGTTYTLLESTDPSFQDQTRIKVHESPIPIFETSHEVDSRSAFYYAVRSRNSCNQEGPFSVPHRVVIGVSPSLTDATTLDLSTDVEQPGLIAQEVKLSRPDESVNAFSITTDVPWLTVSPSSGPIGDDPVAITVASNGDDLALGSNRGVLRVEFTSSGKTISSTTTTVPVSVTLVTPVVTSPGTEPSPDALIVPAVAHADGFNSQWQSDVKVANTTAQSLDYDVRFTESGTNGTETGDSSTLSIVAGQTLSLDDILASVYGEGALGENALGSLEIRPLSDDGSGELGSARLATVVTSRTYNTTESGTFGQFIPPALFSNFIGTTTSRSTISLQHIAQSDAFRTNLGLVEGAGRESDVRFRAYDGSGTLLGEFSTTLMPREHRQISQILATQGLSAEDGRIEVDLTDGDGRITAYASVVDNLTNDPRIVAPAYLPVSPVGRFVVPGVADLDTGDASWRTDMRIFNSGDTVAIGTLRFFPQGAPDSSQDVSFTADPGETLALDSLLAESFGITNAGGVVHVIPDTPAPLVVTARTFNLTTGGTYGQFIPSVTEESGAAMGDPPLQLLQIEQSDQFRTNLGLTEMTGSDARVRITAVVPGSKTAPSVEVDLNGNEFTQLLSILQQLGFSSAYNARVTVETIGGDGRVAAYASVVDNDTQDPTYVPAQ